MTPADLKKELRSRGLLVYRTLPEGVALAEYQRENLLVDAGITVCVTPSFGVKIRFRVEQHAFPGESDAQLYNRARLLATATGIDGLQELAAECTPQNSASDPSRVMDVFYDVTFWTAAPTLDDAAALAGRAGKAVRSLGG